MPALLAFVRLSRLKFLLGGFLAFALGALVARFQGFSLGWAGYIHGQIMVTSFHLMVHYANDYYDRVCDAESERTPWSGGSGMLLDGLLHPNVAVAAAFVCAIAGTITVAEFALEGMPIAACVGVAIGVMAWTYSAPPFRLLARGWGELDTAIIIALLFPLAGYVTFSGRLDASVVVSSLPGICAMLVLMFCVEYPDADVDRRTGKMNLVARLGRARSRPLIYAAFAGAYAASAIAVLLGAPASMLYFSLLTLPVGWGLFRQLQSGDFSNLARNADIAARGVAFYLVTILGAALAYAAML